MRPGVLLAINIRDKSEGAGRGGLEGVHQPAFVKSSVALTPHSAYEAVQ